jgi:4-hydroxy-4-methyl-2-oxoglutarate aldolase
MQRRHSSTTTSQNEAHTASSPRFELLRRRLLALETTVVCDADKVNEAAHPTGLATLQCLDAAIRPLNSDPRLKMVGLARTVSARDEEFLTVLHALCEAEAGEVLMIDAGGSRRAKCGEIFATAAMQQDLAGIVVDGAARDSALIRELPLPYYVRSVTPVAGSTGDAYGKCQGVITVGNCTVAPGNVVFGDADGVLIGSMEAFEALVDAAEAVADVEDRLSKYWTTL